MAAKWILKVWPRGGSDTVSVEFDDDQKKNEAVEAARAASRRGELDRIELLETATEGRALICG